MTAIAPAKPKNLARMAQTAAARAARWPGGAEAQAERLSKKYAEIILFIARLGWSTTEMIGAYMRQAAAGVLKKMQKERLISFDKAIIGDATVSRNLSNGSVATVVLLTEKGHRVAKGLDPKIKKRIARVIQQQTRHDLIAAWAAIRIINERPDLAVLDRSDIAIWSDQVRRQRMTKNEPRPDIVIAIGSTRKIIAIEVERRAKKLGWPQYEFCKKLELFYDVNQWDVYVIVENLVKATTLSKFFFHAENPGLPMLIFSEFDKKYIESAPYQLRTFDLGLSLLVWDHEKKSFSAQFLHNIENPAQPEE